MEVLKGGPLCPSSMSAGNTICDSQPELAMTAPGSPSVNAKVQLDMTDTLPLPEMGTQIPVGRPGGQQHAPVRHASHGGSWGQAGGSGSGWKQVQ